MPVTVTLAGPAPWGFRISGGRDFRKPITVSKVTEQGKAAAGDLRPGDVIVTINGESTAEMLNVEAQNKIKQSPGQLQLQVERSPMSPPSHTNGDSSPERMAARFQDTLWMSEENQGVWRAPSPAPLSTLPGTSSLGSEPAMRRLEEDSEVYKMLQENRELRAAPRQSSTFRLLQEALEEEAGAPFPSRLSPSTRKPAAGAQKLHVCEKCGSSIGTQAVRIQEGRYRHPSCYACADCGLNLKMRGHFWVGDELFCEKHARLRYQGPPGPPPTAPPVTPQS
ncbi:PDZ and LIM domain protein 2 isoform X1 [Heliangelus exortis]|uniref:PDZ and LIM domain protein 2 isoform X1 n=1 Tax=Heliangelus exortis TaxID=472823 RepID=UPI003A905B09